MLEGIDESELDDFLRRADQDGHLSLGRRLDEGKYGVCYELVDQDGQKFAGKFVRNQAGTDRKAVRNERRIQASLNHPNIVRFYRVIEDDQLACFVLELCPRQSLFQLWLARFELDKVADFTRQILLAVKYLHEKLIMHRDLKLDNVFVADDFQLKVGDFGAAIDGVDGDKKVRGTNGTLIYFAPERFDDLGYSYQVDIWAVGVMLYEMLVGRDPFDTDPYCDEQLKKNILTMDPVLPDSVDQDARHLIRWMLNKDPSKRPTIEQVLNHAFLKLPADLAPLAEQVECCKRKKRQRRETETVVKKRRIPAVNVSSNKSVKKKAVTKKKSVIIKNYLIPT